MTLKKSVFAILTLTAGSISLAAGSAQLSKKALENRAAVYLLNKTEMRTSNQNIRSFALNRQVDSSLELVDRDRCQEPEPIDMSCVTFVAGNWPSSEQRAEAARACVGNPSDSCVKFVAGSWPDFDLRVKSAKACRNNTSLACAEWVAGNWPSTEQRLAAAIACDHVDLDCAKFTAGNWPSNDQRLEAARACSGR
jgi:hypothetical protein